MTEKLKTLLHDRATSVEFAAPDLDRLTRAGDRRIRRRRGAAAVGGLAALAVVGGLVAVQLGGDGDGGPTVASDPLPAAAVTWASGTTFRTVDGAIDVGHPVVAYVRTEAGYVFTDGEGAVWSFVDGSTTRVGTITEERPRLVGDTDGSRVVWVDPSGDAPAFVVLDLASGETQRYDEHTSEGMGSLADEEDPAYVYAVDADTAYWRDDRGAVAVALVTGAVEVVDAEARNGFDQIGAEDGLIAFASDSADTVIGTSRADGITLPEASGSRAVFSPDARWVSIDTDDPRVYDTRTGEQVRIDAPRWFATGYEWLSDDTLVMIAGTGEQEPAQLLTCTVPDGACESVVPDLGTFEELEAGEITLPVGEPIG